MAAKLEDSAQRDEVLKRIATSQNEAGAKQAASRTLATIADDRVRAEALDGILAQRIGGPDPALGQIGGFANAAGVTGPGLGGGGGAASADFD